MHELLCVLVELGVSLTKEKNMIVDVECLKIKS
jgi:hypothetical protein